MVRRCCQAVAVWKILMRRNRVISTWCVTGLKEFSSSFLILDVESRAMGKKHSQEEMKWIGEMLMFISFLLCVAFESRIREKNRLICLFGFGWFCTVISAHEKWNTGGERDGGRKKRKNEVYVYIEHIFWDMRELTVSSEMRDVCVHSFHLFFGEWVRESSLN